MSSWLTKAVDAWNWVFNAFWNVWGIVDTWWSVKVGEVRGLISVATQGFAEAALNAWNWVRNSFWNVWGIVDSWWSVKQWEVQGLINTASQGLSSLITTWSTFWGVTWPGWVSGFNSVKSAWDNFWSYTLPSLVRFSGLGAWWDSRLRDVQELISSAFTARDSLWAGWRDMRDQVVSFFADPVEYLWGRFTEWFLGPEG